MNGCWTGQYNQCPLHRLQRKGHQEAKVCAHSLNSRKMGPSTEIMIKEETRRLTYFIISFIQSKELGKKIIYSIRGQVSTVVILGERGV